MKQGKIMKSRIRNTRKDLMVFIQKISNNIYNATQKKQLRPVKIAAETDWQWHYTY
jgi:hypothetical protein